MSPFQILGLPAAADSIQIKRAYARLLRTHRPDEDAAAFQRLHEAYEACLQQARWRAQGWNDFEDEDEQDLGEVALAEAELEATIDGDRTDHGHWPAPDVQPLGAVDEAIRGTTDDFPASRFYIEPAFDAEAFIAELAERMQHEPVRAVEAWLQRHEALYSLDRKRELRPMVVHMLGELPVGAHRENQDVVIGFFGLDSIDSGDEWLHRQLDDTRRRHEDAAEFERSLHKHASKHAMWTDRQLAQELLAPPNWLRRVFIIATPGLPGRVAALSQELRRTDPESAATRLNQAAVHFWERATSRGNLHWQRFAFIVARVGLWNIPISALATRRINPFVDWLAGSVGMFSTWLVYALVVFGFLRFRDYNQRRLQWDIMTVVAAGGTVLGTSLVAWYPIGSMIAYILTGLLWVGARGETEQKASNNAWATVATGAIGFWLAGLIIHRLLGDGVPLRFSLAAASVYSMAVLVLHDVVWARRKRITLDRAHLATGWLWWLFAAQAAALIAMLTVGAS